MEPFTRLARRVGTDDQLSPTARLLFAALDCYLDKRTGHCAPSVGRLAGWIGCTRRTVLRSLTDLEAAGYVAVDRSSGRRNRYRLLPTEAQTSDTSVTGLGVSPVTPVSPVTSDTSVTGLGRAYLMSDLRTKEKEQAPPPRSGDLFAGQYREWFTAALRYHLGDRPDLAELAAWFPQLAAEFFLSQSWQRPNDPETAVGWARRLAAIGTTEAEAVEAFAWALAGPSVDATGRKVFSRPDHLARIAYRIQSQRKRKGGPPGVGPIIDPPAEPSRPERLWASATAAERVEVLALVRRALPDLVPDGFRWVQECADQLARIRQRPAVEVDR